jgi:hypothetical protein
MIPVSSFNSFWLSIHYYSFVSRQGLPSDLHHLANDVDGLAFASIIVHMGDAAI